MNSELIATQLEKLGLCYEENIPLSRFTTFRIGGPAPFMIHFNDEDQLQPLVSFFSREGIPFLIIGEGSNLLVSDEGVDCPVIRFASETPRIMQIANRLAVSAATRFDDVVLFAAKNGLKGLNYASGIHGTVGGAVAGNAGAFGSQIGDVVKQAEILTADGTRRMMKHHELKFSYRSSSLKESGALVLTIHFTLQPADNRILMEEREDILKIRKEKHPDYILSPCAGSFFKNIISPDGTRQAAGWFLERSGCKGLSHGGAAVFEKHANIIINRGGATAEDVHALACEMRRRVSEEFGFELEPEVRYIGRF